MWRFEFVNEFSISKYVLFKFIKSPAAEAAGLSFKK
jgi:hypothetical protein